MKKLFIAVMFVLFGSQASAQNHMLDYYNGYEAMKSGYHHKAIKLFRRSAEAGNLQALNSMGVSYEFGKGVLQDNILAHMWYNVASASGNTRSGEFRDEVADLMSATAIEKATAMARKCMKNECKNCGY